MIEDMNSKREGFREDIVGLRALAVLLVLANHFGISGFSFGFVGVDIFFVVSGYLITRILYKEYLTNLDAKNSGGFIGLTTFYLRRIRRLLPAALTVIFLTNLLSFFLSSPESRQRLLLDSKWALFFLANVSFLRSESNYFALNTEPSLLQHFWSLSVEEQFYFIWPIIFIISAHFHRLRIKKKYVRFNTRLVVLMAAISLLSFVFLQIGFQNSPKSAYFSIFTRAWELGLGGIAGILAAHKKNSIVFSSFERFFPALVSFLFCAFFVNGRNWAIMIVIPVLATAFFLYAGEGQINNLGVRKIVKNPLRKQVLFIGEMSYSLYLVHWPIYILCARYSFGSNLVEKFLLFPISFSFAYILWKHVEKPFQKLRIPNFLSVDRSIFYFIKNKRVVIFGIGFLIISSLYVVTYPTVSNQLFSSNHSIDGLKNDPNLMNYAQYEKQLINSTGSPELLTNSVVETTTRLTSQTLNAISDIATWSQKNSIFIEEGLKKTALTPTEIAQFKVLKYDLSPFEKSKCGNQTSAEIPDCSMGNSSESSPKVALIGDSKMGHLAQPLIDYFIQKGWKVDPLVMFGCRLSNPSNDFQPNCTKRAQLVLQKIASEKYDLILSAEYPAAPSDIQSRKNYLLEISHNTKKLIIFEGAPSFPNTVDCVDSANKLILNCNTSNLNELPSWKLSRSQDESMLSDSIKIIDTTAWFCKNFQCPVVIDGVFVFRDGKHFSYSFAKKISPVLYYYLNQFNLG